MTVTEVERLLVRIMGDNTSYLNALQGAQRQTLYFTQNSAGRFIDFRGRFISVQEAVRRNLQVTMMRIGEFAKRIGGLGKTLRSVSEGFKAFGKNLSLYVTAPLAALATLSAKAAGDFDQSFAGIRKTVNASTEEFNRLSNGMRQLANNIPVSVHTLNDIGAMAGRLGIAVPNIREFTRVTAGLSVSTNLGAEEAATELARFMNIMGTAQTDIERLASSLIQLGNNFATTERWVLDFAVRTAGAAKIAGLSEAEVLGLSAALSSVGIEAEAGGTAVQKMLLKITQAVTLGGENLKKFATASGMSASAFAELWKGAPARALVRFFEGLHKQGTQAIATLQELEISDARSIRAMISLSGATEVLTNALDQATLGWKENLAFTKETETFYNTLWGTIRTLKNRLYDVAITVGDALIPVMKDLRGALEGAIEYLQEWADWFARLSPGVKEFVLIVLSLTAAIGPLTIVMGMFLNSAAAILKVTAALIQSVRALAISITLLKASIYGVVTGVVIFGIIHLLKYFGMMDETSDAVLDNIKRLEEKLANSKFHKITKTPEEFLQSLDVGELEKRLSHMRTKIEAVRKQIRDLKVAWNYTPGAGDQYRDLLIRLHELQRMAMSIDQVLSEKLDLENVLADIKPPNQDVLDFIDKLQGDVDHFFLEGVDREVANFFDKMKKEGVELTEDQKKSISGLAQQLNNLELSSQRSDAAEKLVDQYRTPIEKLMETLEEIDTLVREGHLSGFQGANLAMRAIADFEGAKKLEQSKQSVIASAGAGHLMGSREELLALRGGNVFEEKNHAKETAKNLEQLTDIEQQMLEEAREFYAEALTRLGAPEPGITF